MAFGAAAVVTTDGTGDGDSGVFASIWNTLSFVASLGGPYVGFHVSHNPDGTTSWDISGGYNPPVNVSISHNPNNPPPKKP